MRLELNPQELEHYDRHLKLPGFGLECQLHLKASRVLLVGAGGLGCPMGLYLAAAGVGTIGVVDFDRVERSNLQRQVAHTVAKIGQAKVDSLIEAMQGVNPNLTYVPHPYRLTEDNVRQTIAGYDLVLDGSDNYGTRFLLADACHLAGTPLLQGAVYQYEAQMALFIPGESACYRCVFQEPPRQSGLAACADVGVLGVMPGTVGLMMATEAIKYLSGLPTPTKGTLLRYDALNQGLQHLALEPDANCPLCGPNANIREAREIRAVCPSLTEKPEWTMDAEQAEAFLLAGAMLLDVREGFEFESGHLSGAVHLPLGQLSALAGTTIPSRETAILAYCQRGQRSLEAVRQLRELGYANSYSLIGGIGALENAVAIPV